MGEPRTREWPLIVFTVGLQLAAGIELCSALALWRGRGSTAPQIAFILYVFPITLMALASSLFHLGKPQAAWRAFSHIGQSTLSREVVICSVFCALALGQFIVCGLFGMNPVVLTIVSAVVGVAAVIASAKIYTVPAQQLWNSGWVTSSFIGSTLLLGGVVTRIADGSYISSIMVATGGVVLLVSCARMVIGILRIGKRHYAAPESLPIMQSKHWLTFCGLIVGTAIPILGVLANDNGGALAVAIAIIAVVGVVLGRALMYSRGLALARF